MSANKFHRLFRVRSGNFARRDPWHKKTGPGVNQDRRLGYFADSGVGAAVRRGQFSICAVTQGIVISAVTRAMT